MSCLCPFLGNDNNEMNGRTKDTEMVAGQTYNRNNTAKVETFSRQSPSLLFSAKMTTAESGTSIHSKELLSQNKDQLYKRVHIDSRSSRIIPSVIIFLVLIGLLCSSMFSGNRRFFRWRTRKNSQRQTFFEDVPLDESEESVSQFSQTGTRHSSAMFNFLFSMTNHLTSWRQHRHRQQRDDRSDGNPQGVFLPTAHSIEPSFPTSIWTSLSSSHSGGLRCSPSSSSSYQRMERDDYYGRDDDGRKASSSEMTMLSSSASCSRS